MVYLGNRRYRDSPLRQHPSFPHGVKESKAPPALRVWKESKQVHEAYDSASRYTLCLIE